MDAIFRISHEYSSKQQIGGRFPSLTRRQGPDPNAMPGFALFLFQLTNVDKNDIDQWIKNTGTRFRQLSGTTTSAKVTVQQSPDVTELKLGEERYTSPKATLKTQLVNTVERGVSSAGEGVAAVSAAAGKGGNLVNQFVQRTRNDGGRRVVFDENPLVKQAADDGEGEGELDEWTKQNRSTSSEQFAEEIDVTAKKATKNTKGGLKGRQISGNWRAQDTVLAPEEALDPEEVLDS